MKKFKFNVKAVIFDMDGVITDTMPFHFHVWKKIFEEEGVDVNECEIYLREGQPGIVTIREIFKQHGKKFSEIQARNILSKKEKRFKAILKRRFIKGAISFILFLKDRGIRLSLVTGTSRHEVHRILPKRLYDLFEVIVTGDEVKKGKPHPEPYLKAIKKLKIRPEEVVVIENAPFGIEAAKKAGLSCLALETSLPKNYLKKADYVFHSFAQIRQKAVFLPFARKKA